MHRVGQNRIYTVYIRYFWQRNHQIYGNIRCIYTVLANPKHLEFEPHKSLEWLACEGVTLIEEVLVQCFVFEPHQFLEWYKQNRRVQCPDYVLWFILRGFPAFKQADKRLLSAHDRQLLSDQACQIGSMAAIVTRVQVLDASLAIHIHLRNIISYYY